MARVCVDVLAHGARLRAVSRRYFDQSSATPREFVAQHVGELRPAGTGNAACKAVVLDHALDVQLLDHDGAVALGVVVTETVKQVLALTSHLAVDTRHVGSCFCSAMGSFLSSCYNALCMSESDKRSLKMSWVGFEPTIGVGEQVGDAAIDGDTGLGASSWFWRINLAEDSSKPLIPVSTYRAGLGPPLEWPVHDTAKVTELRKPQSRSVEAPHLRVRFTEPENVSAAPLPVRLHGDALETSLPSLVQLDQRLRTDVAGDGCEPRKRGPQRGQRVDLVEGCWISLGLAAAREAHQPLLKGEVPEEPESRLPCRQPSHLAWGRVDAEAESLADQHTGEPESMCTTNRATSSVVWLRREDISFVAQARRAATTERGFLPVMNGGVSAPEIR